MDKSETGRKGESFCEEYYRKRGYEIKERNYHSRYGEIDIIGQDQEYILFVEVKTRKEASLISGSEAVDAFKRARIIKTAEDFNSLLPFLTWF